MQNRNVLPYRIGTSLLPPQSWVALFYSIHPREAEIKSTFKWNFWDTIWMTIKEIAHRLSFSEHPRPPRWNILNKLKVKLSFTPSLANRIQSLCLSLPTNPSKIVSAQRPLPSQRNQKTFKLAIKLQLATFSFSRRGPGLMTVLNMQRVQKLAIPYHGTTAWPWFMRKGSIIFNKSHKIIEKPNKLVNQAD